MSRITVIGGNGYTGSAIVAEAAKRGHQVTSVSRSAPSAPIPGVTYVEGSALDTEVQAKAFEGADAVVTATSPRGDMADRQLELSKELAFAADAADVPLVVVGGYSSLRPSAEAPRYIEGEVAEQYRAEALAGHSVLEMLMASPDGVKWTFVSPPAKFGAWVPGEATGTYRLGGDVALEDTPGTSAISAQDFALAILDVIESGEHVREHISAAN